MIKKLIWMVMLVLATAFSVLFNENGGFSFIDPTATQAEVITTTPIATEILTQEATLENTATSELPTATAIVTSTLIPTGTALPTMTATATVVVPTATPTKTSTPVITPTSTTMPFRVQGYSPVYISNFAHTNAGCAWQGVAGQVFDKAGNPVTNYIVKVTGEYNGSHIDLVGITGMVDGTPYGPASFELVLGPKAIDSVSQLVIQLFNPKGEAITPPTPFNTYSACTKNLVVINFMEN